MKKLIVLSLTLLWATGAYAFTTRTPLGIKLSAADTTVTQYNKHWATWDENPDVTLFPKRPGIYPFYKNCKSGPTWDQIDWSVIDDWFMLLRDKYKSYPNPRDLTIEIMPLNYNCMDESPFPYNYEFFIAGYGCIDGIFYNPNLIRIHLGDDAGMEWWGQRNRPFCATALDWEMRHSFLYWRGDACWDNETSLCNSRYKDVHEMCE
jgi:hypothetical protein